MSAELNKDQIDSIRDSYLNILALFLEEEKIESRYIRCLVKWGIQLKFDPDELMHASKDISTISFSLPSKIDKLEAIYHLVYMIYLDKVVEDNELAVATIYAQKLGFSSAVVNELFKSIATADYDETETHNVRDEVIEFLKLHDQGA